MHVFDLTIIGLIARGDGTCALSAYHHELDAEWIIEVHNPPISGTQLSLLINFTYTVVTDEESRQTMFMKNDDSLIATNYYNDLNLVDNWMEVVYNWMDNNPESLQEI